MASMIALTIDELVQELMFGDPPLARELADQVDAGEEMLGVADEFGELAPDVSLQDEACRRVVFEHRVRALLEDWAALNPADPIVVLLG